MPHVVRVEVLQADGRTLEVTPVGGVRSSAPLVPGGELLEIGGQEYVVLAIRRSMAGYGSADWDEVTTYLVDEAEDDKEFVPGGPDENPEFTALIREVWGGKLGGWLGGGPL